jgi:hypothetical protein
MHLLTEYDSHTQLQISYDLEKRPKERGESLFRPNHHTFTS